MIPAIGSLQQAANESVGGPAVGRVRCVSLPALHAEQLTQSRALTGEKRYAEAERETLAGYNILLKQTSPTVSWLQSARKDLVTIYQALGQTDKAAHFRAELETASVH